MQDSDPERVRERETERSTTIIDTGGERRDGGSGVVVAIVALVVLALLLFFLFGGGLGRDAEEGDVNVNIDAPEVNLPAIELPDVNITVPETDDDPPRDNAG